MHLDGQVMVMAAPNGARRTKADHSRLPMTHEEIVADAVACIEAGAAAVHLHVRDDEGKHTLDPGRYQALLADIRALSGSGPVLQITTEAVGRYSPEEQMDCVRAVRPESVSIALKELIPDSAHERAAQIFLAWAWQERIAVQFILYEAGEVHRLRDLVASGVVPWVRPFALFVLGRYTPGQQSTPKDLDPFVAAMEGAALSWAMCAFGRQEGACAIAAACAGGHVRIGFENNFHLPDGRLAASNAELVGVTVASLRNAGFVPMTARAARAMMGVRRPVR